ncbi:MAG: hypothetical protein PHO60_09540, partial [Methanothrix sp.]|nr:hypothetical protein [Methanothrix sp.]
MFTADNSRKFGEGMDMRGVGTIMKIWAALLVMLVVLGPAWAADNPKGYYMKNEQKLEQDVEGEGYAMVYQNVNTKTLQLKNYMHGSGSMDAAILLSSNQSKGMVYTQGMCLAPTKMMRIDENPPRPEEIYNSSLIS